MKNEPEKKEGELIPESDCARNLGLELKVLEEVRERVLVPEDYVLTPDGAQYRPHAVRKVLAALEAPEELAGECAKKEGPVTLYVSRKFRNSRIREATPDRLHHEPACLVRVPDSGRFSLGAALEAVSVEGEIWRLHGRAPRRLVKPAAIPAAVAKKEEGAL